MGRARRVRHRRRVRRPPRRSRLRALRRCALVSLRRSGDSVADSPHRGERLLDGARKLERSEARTRVEIALSRFVDHPQEPMAPRLGVREREVDLSLLQRRGVAVVRKANHKAFLGVRFDGVAKRRLKLELPAADSVSSVPSYLCVRDGAIGRLEGSERFQLAPAAPAIDFGQAAQLSDSPSGGDRLDIAQRPDDFEVHCARLPAGPRPPHDFEASCRAAAVWSAARLRAPGARANLPRE